MHCRFKITRRADPGQQSRKPKRVARAGAAYMDGFRSASFPECFCNRAKLTYNNEVVLSVRSKAISPMHVCAAGLPAWICEGVRAPVCITESAALITTVRLRGARNLINDVYISMARLTLSAENLTVSRFLLFVR
jgi:hypothetical protein